MTHCSGVVARLDVLDDLLLVLADDILGCLSPKSGNIASSLSENISELLLFIERVVGLRDIPEIRNCSQSRVRHLGTPVTFYILLVY